MTTTADAPKNDAHLDTLLTGPAPKDITKEIIDFGQTVLPEYKGSYAVVMDNVLTAAECDALLTAAEAHGNGHWERAMINVGGGRQEMYTDVRNCGRIIWDDREMVARLWARCAPQVPEIARLENMPGVTGGWSAMKKEVWNMTRLNERMRFLKYVGGEYFKAHCDGMYETPDRKERSYYTLHLYLNDETSENREKLLKGGATTFHSYNMREYMDIMPKAGRVLIFQHRDLLHSGDDVVTGTKYTLRTDIMYQKA